MSRSENITIKDIWKLTDGGEKIFRKEIGEISYSHNISAPWRNDSNPSVRLKKINGRIVYNDYGGDMSSGTALDFLMKLYGLSLPQAIEKIKQDFNITAKDRIYTTEFNDVKIEKEPIIYEFNDMPFSKEHHKYWNKIGLSEDFVNKEGDIYAVRKWAVNRKIQEIGLNEIVFGYIYKNEHGEDTGLRKILRLGPEVDKKDKWRTNVSNTKLWYVYKYLNKDIKQLFIVKSNKDALCTMKQGIASIATQSENDIILSQNIPYLKEICPNLVLNFGSDPQGTQASINVSKEFQLPWFNCPKSYLRDGVNDNAGYIEEFGEECFKQLLKDKNYL